MHLSGGSLKIISDPEHFFPPTVHLEVTAEKVCTVQKFPALPYPTNKCGNAVKNFSILPDWRSWVGHHGCMRILTNPRVALKWHTPDAEREIEMAGRVCWESWGRSDGSIEDAQGFIRRLKRVGHIDVMEEAELSVWIECSRTASHQIVRHRTQHHLQASQRYIKVDEAEILVPPAIEALKSNGEYQIFLTSVVQSYYTYERMLESGIRREDARFVLPNCALTKMKAKANLANWRKFISLRSDSTAQWEVRAISNAVLRLAYDVAPSVFEDQYEKYIIEDENHLMADIVDRSEFEGVFLNGQEEE